MLDSNCGEGFDILGWIEEIHLAGKYLWMEKIE